MSTIYGIDTTKEITPEMVRDVLLECFSSAHAGQCELTCEDSKLKNDYCNQIVVKAFSENNGDFDHPAKASLTSAVSWLANFSKPFRDQAIIQKHMEEIQKLIATLK